MNKAKLELRIDRADSNAAIALLLVFAMRWLLSDNQSYWHDELISVTTYGIDNDTVRAAIEKLARRSIHPPLYQIILFYWMKIVGNSEVTTRFLSNIFVSGAAVCMYIGARSIIGKRRALASIIVFSLMYGPFYYALETRSYGQSLFLTTTSFVALFHLMRLLVVESNWKRVLLSRACFILIAGNFCLLMTHYYNIYFLVSQAAFLFAWSWFHTWRTSCEKPIRLLDQLTKTAVPLLIPFILFVAVWGSNLAHTFGKRSGQYVLESSIENPVITFVKYAVRPNFKHIDWVFMGLLGVLLLLFYANQVVDTWRRRRVNGVGKPAFTTYIFVNAFGPFLVAYVSFLVLGHERYASRYFLYTAPSFAFLLIIAIEEAVQIVDSMTRRTWFSRVYLKWSTFFTLAAVTLVLPGTYEAATRSKTDWRGTARLISDIVTSDPKHRYLIYSTGHTKHPSLDYYFKRIGKDIKTNGLLFYRNEKKYSNPISRAKYKKIEKHDFLIVAFMHVRSAKYPKTLSRLNERYTIHQNLIIEGRGVIIYRVNKRSEGKK